MKRLRITRDNHFATEAVVISAQIESELVDLSEQEALDYLRGLGVKTAACTRSFARFIICSGCARSLPLAKRKRAHGPFTPATKRRPPPARFTPISSAVLSRRKPFTYSDLVALGSFAKAREAGKLRMEGKDYDVRRWRRDSVPVQRVSCRGGCVSRLSDSRFAQRSGYNAPR